MASALLSNMFALVGPAVEQARMVPIQTLGSPFWDLAGVTPTLDLYFAQSQTLLDSVTGQNLITFSRPSTGTYVGSDGLIKTADSGVPRFTHDPVTRECLGLLVEEQRTNLLIRSEQFDDATWIKGGLTVTANQAEAPDGTLSGDSINITNSGHSLYAFATVTASTTYTFSFYAKRGTATTAAYSIVNDSAGGANIVAPTSYFNQTSASAWSRIAVTFTTPVGCTSIAVCLERDSGSSSGNMHFWGAQLEAGATATSYIPTTTASATRSADTASIRGSSFSDFYTASQGTIYSSATSYVQSVVAGIFSLNASGSASNRIDRRITSYSIITSGGSTVASLNNGLPFTAGTSYRSAVAAAANDFACFTNGGSLSADTSGAMPTGINQLEIGSVESGIAKLNGPIARLTYWPVRLPNATLQALTS